MSVRCGKLNSSSVSPITPGAAGVANLDTRVTMRRSAFARLRLVIP